MKLKGKARSGDESGAKLVLTELNKARCDGADPYNISSLSGQSLPYIIHTQSRCELWGEGKSLFYAKQFKRTMVRNYPRNKSCRNTKQMSQLIAFLKRPANHKSFNALA